MLTTPPGLRRRYPHRSWRIFVLMELPRRAGDHVPIAGAGEKMSKHSLSASDVAGLLHRSAELKCKAAARTGRGLPIIVIQEVGLDGFWITRCCSPRGTRATWETPPGSDLAPSAAGEDRPDRWRGPRDAP